MGTSHRCELITMSGVIVVVGVRGGVIEGDAPMLRVMLALSEGRGVPDIVPEMVGVRVRDVDRVRLRSD